MFEAHGGFNVGSRIYSGVAGLEGLKVPLWHACVNKMSV